MVSIEYKDVEVVVTNSYYRPMWRQPVKCGKTTAYILHPAIYRISVTYNGAEYTVSGSDTYRKYKNRVGEMVTGTLEERRYDNGNISLKITELE